MKMKKLVALATALVLSSAAMVGCGSNNATSDEKQNAQNSETIKIGGSFALTGDVAIYGVAANNGVKLAMKEYNEAGGILGKQIEYIVEDNKGQQVDAANAFKKLVDNDKVELFIGSDISSATETIANIAKEKKVPMITPTATKLSVTEIGENIFRACYIDPYQGQMLATLATEDLGAKTAAIMVNSESDYSVGIAEAFQEAFEAVGGKVAVKVNYAAQDKDFKPILMNVKNANPDIVVIPEYYSQVALIAAQAKEVGITAKLLGGDGWDGVTEQVSDPAVLENSYFVNHYSPEDDNELVKNFLEQYRKEYNEEPNAFAVLGYDAAKIMIEATKQAGSTDYDAVVNAMKATSLDGVTGHISFDENRNPIKSVAVIQIKEGKNTLYKKLEAK